MENTASFIEYIRHFPGEMNEYSLKKIEEWSRKGYTRQDLNVFKAQIQYLVRNYEMHAQLFMDYPEMKSMEFGGEAKELHYDSGISQTGKGYSPFQMVIMLSKASDYDGGELAFPNQNKEYKLDRGDIIIFPSNFLFPHEVKSFTGYRKACYPHFVADNRYN